MPPSEVAVSPWELTSVVQTLEMSCNSGRSLGSLQPCSLLMNACCLEHINFCCVIAESGMSTLILIYKEHYTLTNFNILLPTGRNIAFGFVKIPGGLLVNCSSPPPFASLKHHFAEIIGVLPLVEGFLALQLTPMILLPFQIWKKDPLKGNNAP